MSDRPRLFVLDGTALLYRGHFAMMNNPLVTKDGFVTSGIFGFMNTMVMIMKKEKPDYLIATFDDKAPTFRKEMYTEYKANREKMPDELAAQIEPLDHILASMKLPMLRMPGFEADDIMGTLATQAEAKGWDTYLVTGDKDMMQLVNDHTFVYMPPARRNPVIIYDHDKVVEKWGVPPEKLVDLLGLMGDSSDNIPGVEGVGVKTAVKLIDAYGSLEGAIEHADEVGNKRAREGLQKAHEIGPLSKQLATIDCEVPIDLDLEQSAVKFLNADGAVEELTRLEIRAVVPNLIAMAGGSMPAETVADRPEKFYTMVTDEAALKQMVDSLTSAPWVSFDTETTSLDTFVAELVGMSFSIKPHHGWYVPVAQPEGGQPILDIDTVLDAVRLLLESPDHKLVGQNIKYDLQVMHRHGIDLDGIIFDTMIAAHLLDPDGNSYKLDNLSIKHLDYQMVPIEDLIGPKGKNQISMAEVPLEKISDYAAEDADVVASLYPMFAAMMEKEGTKAASDDLETPLIPVLAEMERGGVYLDIDFLNQMSADLGTKLDSLQEQVITAAGTEFNVNSPQQLGVVLFDQLELPQIRKRSTDVTVLEMLRDKHELPGLILDYRQVKKLKSTYVDALPLLLNEKTGRIHTSFSQTTAATGRLSSTNPNFQNIPIRTEMGREIRKAFVAPEAGWGILSADYSQIELRIMAHLAQEQALLTAFREGQDIHRRTAATVFGVPLEDVTADQRRTAKVVNFGIMYGAGPYRMSQELDISIAEGKEIIDRYFNTYPGIRLFVDSLLADARETGYVSTLGGRRRRVPNLNADNKNLRSADERVAVNTPIQGTAAELIKMAMLSVHRRLRDEKFEARMILQIHDELLFETPESEVERLSKMVVEEMEGAMSLDVPLKVEWGFGPSWYEAH